MLASHLVLLSVAAAENPVSAAGSQSRALLRRVAAKCQPDWKWNRRRGVPREAPFFCYCFYCTGRIKGLFKPAGVRLYSVQTRRPMAIHANTKAITQSKHGETLKPMVLAEMRRRPRCREGLCVGSHPPLCDLCQDARARRSRRRLPEVIARGTKIVRPFKIRFKILQIS